MTPPPMHREVCRITHKDTTKEAKLHVRQCPSICIFIEGPLLHFLSTQSQARNAVATSAMLPHGKSIAPPFRAERKYYSKTPPHVARASSAFKIGDMDPATPARHALETLKRPLTLKEALQRRDSEVAGVVVYDKSTGKTTSETRFFMAFNRSAVFVRQFLPDRGAAFLVAAGGLRLGENSGKQGFSRERRNSRRNPKK